MMIVKMLECKEEAYGKIQMSIRQLTNNQHPKRHLEQRIDKPRTPSKKIYIVVQRKDGGLSNLVPRKKMWKS